MMDEKYIDLVTGYVQNTLNEAEQQKINDLIKTGKIDILDLRDMEAIVERLDTIQVPEPGSNMNDRFYAMLEEEKKIIGQQKDSKRVNIKSGSFPGPGFRRFMYAAAIFLFGLLMGSIFTPVSNQNEQIDMLAAEVSQMREVMMLTMLDNPSPVERLRAVNISYDIRTADDRVIDALLQTLDNDTNVNVRLAAVNALMEHAANPEVRAGLINSITRQEAPVVQVALADAMLTLQEERSVDEFKILLERNELDTNVRDKVEYTIAALI